MSLLPPVPPWSTLVSLPPAPPAQCCFSLGRPCQRHGCEHPGWQHAQVLDGSPLRCEDPSCGCSIYV